MAKDRFHIDQNVEDLMGEFENHVFFNCTFRKLNKLTLKNCDLNQSKVLTDNIRDALGFTVTLDCHSFENVEISELLFDLMLILLIKSKGNTEKRRKLIQVIGGRERVIELLSMLKDLERLP